MAILWESYQKQIVPAIKKKFGYKNNHQVPRLKKIVVNMGIGKASEDIKILEEAQKELAAITGQMPAITRAKKAISNFKIRENSPVGLKVTLRRNQMYEFLTRLIHIALPRIRDFRGVSPKGFDGQGNFAFGISDQTIFPEIESDKVQRTQGMDIVMHIKSASPEASRELLSLFGIPFRSR